MRQLMIILCVWIVLAFVLSGCSEENDMGKDEVLKETVVQFNIPIPNLAPFSSVSTITVIVTAGPNDSKVLGTATLTVQGNTATGEVIVLVGKDRVFTVEAKDKDGVLIGSGTTTADVIIGKTVTVDIPIQFLTGDVVVNTHWEDPNQPADILPGEGAAKIKLMDPFSKAKSLYGNPIIDPKYPQIFGYSKIGLIGGVLDSDKDNVIDDNEPIILLMIFDPYSGKTAGGNGIGSTRTDVEREFGVSPDIEPDKANNEETHMYEKKGIDLTYDLSTKRVINIFVYPVLEGAPQRVNSMGYNLKLLRQNLR